ncbi:MULTISPECIES: hypothetical protein [unclassified Pseudoalteromonas]|uniref:hypothetical protein n=1 Tax=unclassified Pseudoalteromonas TaxID=194690 RepID=UPI000CF716BE|nr:MULTISPECIES: hypothetical protein [unclassified Pseudoalteromonas]MBS3797533.1 hypothetical protein [Pseudoalteromonas sp. BDTF-M6]
MKFSKLAAGIALATLSAGALAGGPLYIHEKTMQPYKWNTANGTIPVWTDGGQLIKDKDGNDVQAFTILEKGTKFNVDITLPDGEVLPKNITLDRDYTFLTIAQANAVTADAVAQWSNVETSTLDMAVAGTIESQTGISDVNASNVDQIYGAENGYGFWVNYDSDGAILEEYFGIPRNQVLGIAFPEWADEETGEITEATALMNGWYIDINDTEGKMVQGVFTHEFGHAMNMSHSQANGHLTYIASPWSPQYDGVPGCSTTNEYTRRGQAPADGIETMFPFINVRSAEGAEQGTVNVRDDIVNISDLYPTADYKTKYGTIKGKLLTKDGVEYSGMNMIARNLDNPMYDVITQQTGNMTQGRIGPDGSFTINGLTPGGRYALYMEPIRAGGYPTTPSALISESEYWNSNENSSPATDNACDMTEIVVAGGETKEIEMHFNGYNDGIQYTPLVQAFVTEHAKNGKKALGTTYGGVPFVYDSVHNTFDLMFAENGAPLLSSTTAAMNKTATKAAVVADLDGNGIGQGAVWDIRSGKLTVLEDLTNNTCYLSSQQGVSSHSIWDIDDEGKQIVGVTRKPNSGGDECATGQGASSYAVPTVWDVNTGKATLLLNGLEFVKASYGSRMYAQINGGRTEAWIRADAISGNGEVITGTGNSQGLVAWVDGELHDINTMYGARDTAVMSTDGEQVAFNTLIGEGRNRKYDGIKVWNTKTDEIKSLGSLRWCDDIPYIQRWTNYCEAPYNLDHEYISSVLGVPSMLPLDANEDLSVITARYNGGSAIYMEGLGWMKASEFFARQGVVEAKNLLTDNWFAMSANGSEMMAGLAGVPMSIEIDANKAFVCKDGTNQELSFPKQVIAAVKSGAEFGRCEHLDDTY